MNKMCEGLLLTVNLKTKADNMHGDIKLYYLWSILCA